LVDDEIDAAGRAEYLNHREDRRGPAPFRPRQGVAIPVLECLLGSARTVTEVARLLGVTRRTVCRWRAGTAKPGKASIARMESIMRGELCPHEPN
jgi:hypothetical protein